MEEHCSCLGGGEQCSKKYILFRKGESYVCIRSKFGGERF